MQESDDDVTYTAVADADLTNTGEVYSGGFLITSFESSGEYNKAELVAITLESSGTTSLIDNDFRIAIVTGKQIGRAHV